MLVPYCPRIVFQGLIDIPPEGHVSLCYIDGKLCCGPYPQTRLEDFTKVASHLPDVNVPKEMQRNAGTCEDYQEVFRRVESPLLQRLFHIWLEQGFIAALDYTASPSVSLTWLRTTAEWMISATTHIGRVLGRTCNPKESLTDKVCLVTQVREWERSNVRAMAWSHVHFRLAVAAHDDSVRIFSHFPACKDLVLKCRGQQNVSCIAWRPFSEQELAVGSSSGIILWDVEPKALATRSVRVLQQPGHIPVTSLAWSPSGDILLSASSDDSSIYAWDPDNERSACLRQVLSSGTGLLAWSPSHTKVLIASTGFVFRVWETKRWRYERWTIPSGRVQTACWNAGGDILLFATTEEACIYALVFSTHRMVLEVRKSDSPVSAHRILDLTFSELVTGERIGGLVQSMTWDATSKFLAIIFKGCDLVILYETELSLTISITPCCIIRGPAGHIPNVMAFMPEFSGGALLAIAWSNGQVQYFPVLEKRWTSSELCTNGEPLLLQSPVVL